MNKRLPWFKTVLLVAMACGIAAFWFVDAWLTPGPQVFALDQLVPHELTIYGHLYDLSHRWLAVHARPSEDNPQFDQRHFVFDLEQKGRQVNEFTWKKFPGRILERVDKSPEQHHYTT